MQRLRLQGFTAHARELGQWAPVIRTLATLPVSSAPVAVDTPLGALYVVRMGMGFGGRSGSLWFGALDPAFPERHAQVLLKAAATLAATGLQAARIDEERARASRAKDEFLAMLGHELRNPLAPIFTSLEVIKRRSGTAVDPAHAIIERQARHLSRLVDDLLDVSRVATGKVELAVRPVPLRGIVDSALEAVAPLMSRRGHSIELRWVEEPAMVLGDPTRLVQVFVNLLTNAAKYTPPGGHVMVSARIHAGQVIVAIQDNGTGFSAELKPRLFRIFEQGNNSVDRPKGGLGIGLALVHNFVQLHGGGVTAESEGPGRGATFTVSLPLCEAAVEDAAASSAAAQPGRTGHTAQVGPPGGRRVLLVDDNVDALESLASVLTLGGFEVATATRPSAAIALMESFKPAIAILDVGLPEMDGYQLARELAASPHRLPGLRLITLSGYGLPRDHERAVQAGLERHLVKPVDPDALMRLLVEGRG